MLSQFGLLRTIPFFAVSSVIWAENPQLVVDVNKLLTGPARDQRVSALLATRVALNRIESPNFCTRLQIDSIGPVLKKQLAHLSLLKETLPPLSEVTLEPTIEALDGALRIAVAFNGNMPIPVPQGSPQFLPQMMLIGNHGFATGANVPKLVVKGKVSVLSAASFDGAAISLFPIDMEVRVSNIDIASQPNGDTAKGISEALTSLSRFVVSGTSSVVLPVDLTLTTELDIAKLFSNVAGAKLSHAKLPKVPMTIVADSSALFVEKNSISIVGTLRTVSEAERQSAFAELRQIYDQIKHRLPAECPTCQVPYSENQWPAFSACLQKSRDCQENRLLQVNLNPAFVLTPVQRLAMGELLRHPDGTSQEIARGLRFVSASATVSSGSTADGGFAPLFSEVRQRFQEAMARVGVDPGQDAGSLVAFHQEFLSSSVNRLGALLAGSSLTLDLDPAKPSIHETISTPPAPDLKCEQNLPACNSVFEYPAYSPMGCNSGNCINQQCFFGACWDTVDFNCVRDKFSCEAEKERRRLAYEGEKSFALARWSIEKAACELRKEVIKKGCEINQGFLNDTANREVGKIDGSASITSARVNLTIQELSAQSDLSSIRIRMVASGAADISASAVFTPLNEGHVICPVQWGGDLKAALSIFPKEFSFQGTLSGTALTWHFDSTEVKARFVPGPATALLSQNPHALIACPLPSTVLALIAGNLLSPVGQILKPAFASLDDDRTFLIPEFSGALNLVRSHVDSTFGKYSTTVLRRKTALIVQLTKE